MAGSGSGSSVVTFVYLDSKDIELKRTTEMPTEDRYHTRRQAALAWLGDRYLLATPINRRK